MDNVCHTLIGAALGEAGLKKWTRYGNATLMIASNLPDIDVAVFATTEPSVSFRRGWTHGVVGDALLPILLAALIMAFDRMRHMGPPQGAAPTRVGADPRVRPSFAGLLALSYIGVLLHVFFDLLNNYGVRLLMPFSQHWFYGDVLFITDPWLIGTLAVGIWLSRTRRSTVPAQRAVLVSAVYVLVMLVSARAARATVIESWTRDHTSAPRSIMVGPVFADPLHKHVIVDRGDDYLEGTFSWLSRGVRFEPRSTPKNDTSPQAAHARTDRYVQALLSWSRFPYYEVENGRVVVSDMRFGRFIAAVGAAKSPGS